MKLDEIADELDKLASDSITPDVAEQEIRWLSAATARICVSAGKQGLPGFAPFAAPWLVEMIDAPDNLMADRMLYTLLLSMVLVDARDSHAEPRSWQYLAGMQPMRRDGKEVTWAIKGPNPDRWRSTAREIARFCRRAHAAVMEALASKSTDDQPIEPGRDLTLDQRATLMLKDDPTMVEKTSIQWAELLECTDSVVRGLPTWKNLRTCRGAGSPQRAPIPAENVGVADDSLENLLREQGADDRADNRGRVHRQRM